MLKVIIENGVMLLQTPAGVRVPAVIDTKVFQKLRDPGTCQFSLYVNGPGWCQYAGQGEPLIMPDGTPLEGVEVRAYSPNYATGAHASGNSICYCFCTVGMSFDTTHKAEAEAAVSNTP